MLTALDGTKIRGNAHSLLFRWDVVEGIRIITFFTAENIVGIMTEIEHEALALTSAISASKKTDFDVFLDSAWSHKLNRFSATFSFREPTRDALAKWGEIPETIVETWLLAIQMHAGMELVRRQRLLAAIPAGYESTEDPIYDPTLYAVSKNL